MNTKKKGISLLLAFLFLQTYSAPRCLRQIQREVRSRLSITKMVRMRWLPLHMIEHALSLKDILPKRRAEQRNIFIITATTNRYGHSGFTGVLNMMAIVQKLLMQIIRNPFMSRFGLLFPPMRTAPVRL